MTHATHTAGRRSAERATRRGPDAAPYVPRPRGRFGGRLIAAILWAGLVASVVPWVQQTPTGSLQSTGAVMTAAGQITGLIAGYLLLVQVLLMSRLRILERLIGTESIARWHRDIGVTLLVAVVLHSALIVVGYAGVDQVSLFDEVDLLWNNYEDLPSAFIATGLLVFIGLTSIRAARKAMPYEFWHVLHLSSYAALLLGFGHQFANGQQLSQPGLNRNFWIGMYVVVLVSLVWGRLIAPLRFNRRHQLEVADIVAESPDTTSIYLIGRQLDRLRVLGGQFFRWRFLARGCWWQSHPFSISAAGNDRWLRITVKSVGQHTADLRELEPGTRVWAEGPFGRFTAADRTQERALLIAGGSGIAPIRALLEELPPGAALIYRASRPEDVMLYRELDWLADARGIDLRYVVGSRTDPGPSQVMSPRGLRFLVPDLTERDVFLCGPDGLMEEAVKSLREAGVPRRQIHLATFEL